jgi:UDP-N-acetylmuramate dehydrogenase
VELINNAPLQAYTTFGVKAVCDHLYRVEDVEELRLAAQYLDHPLILGGGSNILPIGDLHRNVLRIELKGKEIVEEGPDPLVWVAAGEKWHETVLWALGKDLGGIENLSLIPGTMGAAPIQNIGAYGVELESVFDRLEAIEIGTGDIHVFNKEECRFGYRDSIFKQEARGRFIITGVFLRLHRDPVLNTTYGAISEMLQTKGITRPTIHDVSEAVISIRKSKLPDPELIGNAGSFFKNPTIPAGHFDALKLTFPDMPGYPSGSGEVKVPAGWLIEKAGWKGKSQGKAGCYEKQALVLVNLGGATGDEIWALAERIIDSVNTTFQIVLAPEVNVWR